MALIFCPECGTQVSEHAQQCIKCAYPIYKLKINPVGNVNTNQQYNLHFGKKEIITNNTIVWFIAFTPLLDMFLRFFISVLRNGNEWAYHYYGNWWVGIILYFSLCISDQTKLKNEGIDTKSFRNWWILLTPIYLYKRANSLGQSLAYFWVNILASLLTIAILFL